MNVLRDDLGVESGRQVSTRGTGLPVPDLASRRRRPRAMTDRLLPGRASHQAFIILYLSMIALPMVAGIDKFFNTLGPWDRHLAPQVVALLPFSTHAFMMLVGVFEIVAGGIVAWRPRLGGRVLAVWFTLIIIDLLLAGHGYDIILRDVGLVLGAWVLSRLAVEFGP